MTVDVGMSIRQKTWLLEPPFRREGPVGWICTLPAELHLRTDSNEEPYCSRLRMLEDGRELGPPHSLHETILAEGGGAYSFWGNAAYFSTSDGSDPNTNGRVYSAALAGAEIDDPPSGLSQPADVVAGRGAERRLRIAVYGLGQRGLRLAELAQSLGGGEVTWAVDDSQTRVDHGLYLFGKQVRGTTDLAEPLADSSVDAVLVAVPDHLHRPIAEAAFRAGKDVFLEKPIATSIDDAAAILDAWRQSGRVLQLGYVLRQAPFFQAIREVIRQGVLGPIRIANLSEQLSVLHGASFMRRWHARSAQSGGLLVHKACHDLDIICWLTDSRPRVVTSFGGLDTFAGPAPAEFCSRCDQRSTCPYVDNGLYERRTPAEMANPTAFGLDRCVFRDDKDIVDNQIVSFVMDSGMRGTFHLAMQGPGRSERRISLIGDRGRLEGTFEDGGFTVTFTDSARPPYVWTAGNRMHGGHGGGDRITMLEFLNACSGRAPAPVSGVEEAIRGLVFALAAERARREERLVRLTDADFAAGQQ